MAQENMWLSCPQSVQLNHNDVHVWRAIMGAGNPDDRRLSDSLSKDEHAQAERFRFVADRQRFIWTRGVLRAILARYIGINPQEIVFAYNSHGKPFLAGQSAADGLSFNMTHSHGLALYAVARGRRVGIDVEYMSADLAKERIAEHFFSAAEVAVLRALPVPMQNAAFYNCWTRKEAFIKAIGQGLSYPLDRFDVSLAPGEPAAILTIRDDPDEAGRWALQELHPGDGYVAAIAVEGHNWRLRRWHWTGL